MGWTCSSSVGIKKCIRTLVIWSYRVTVEWLALLFRIQDDLNSNLGPETGYSD
jgi:hypothetical protein